MELQKYHMLLSSEWPEFIDKYLCLIENLKQRTQFCGCDYTKLYPIRYLYTRFDHSVSCALMAWHFTHDKKKTIAALLHDKGTPAFSHCIDYVKGDYENQESAEMDLKEVLSNSKELLLYLKEDGLCLSDIIPIDQYSIVDIERPGICVDRLDGILHTNLIWLQTWQLDDVSFVYQDMKILKNQNGKEEIGFSSVEMAERFYEGAYTYSITFQKNEDRLVMQLIADIVKSLIHDHTVELADLYQLDESKLVDIIKSSKYASLWKTFSNLEKIWRSEEVPTEYLYMIPSFPVKKRFVIPLCEYQGKTIRLDEISSSCQTLLHQYEEFQDSHYAYIKK